jgi:hypothetical protein
MIVTCGSVEDVLEFDAQIWILVEELLQPWTLG